MQEVVERRGGEEAYDVETRSMQENARKCGEATREPDIKPNECRKLLRGTGGSLDCETRRDTGEEVQILKQDERNKFLERLGPGESIDIQKPYECKDIKPQ
jgi:hypothetical protein